MIINSSIHSEEGRVIVLGTVVYNELVLDEEESVTLCLPGRFNHGLLGSLA